MKINSYFKKKIIWKQDKQNGILFNSVVDGIECKLRINNFPIEPMYTLMVNDEEIDFDDKPDLWEINYIKSS